ncbi:MAG: hypothetical protein [Circular genetic element sp.]|nr:MAG: hypothetical protein [Circular genetic element sp.]
MRFDFRDFEEERRDALAELERERREDARALSEEAKRKLEEGMKQISVEDLRDMVNNPAIKITPDGRISSRRVTRMPSGRDVIRRSGQFTMQGFDLPGKKPRKKNKKHCKNLSMCLRQANAELRTKSGKLRKGKTQADIMRRAQKLLRKC